ncbi:MAG: undecaprenyl-phosphate galactose phosphotransferase WbaP [Planctomycetaceae bacterium]
MPSHFAARPQLSDPGLVDPIVSTEALEGLNSGRVRRDRRTASGWNSQEHVPPSRRMEGARLRQVVLTALPLMAADLLSLAVSFGLASVLVSSVLGRQFPPTFLNNLVALCCAHLVIGLLNGLYPATGVNPVAELRRQLTSMGMACMILLVLNAVFGVLSAVEVLILLVATLLLAVLAPMFRFQTRHLFAKQKWWGESAIIVGTGAHERAVLRHLEALPQRGLKPIGVVDDTPADYWRNTTRNDGARFLGVTSDLVSICRSNDCHWVMLFAGGDSTDRVVDVLEESSLVPNIIMLYTNVMIPTLWTSTFEAAGLAGVHIRDRLLQPYQRIAKRLCDMAVSALLLLVLLPVWILVGLAVRLMSPGPAFYSHARIGRSGRTFHAWKFRTMVRDSDKVLKEYLESNPAAELEWRETQKLKNDPRVIPGIGHFLRRTSIDELPQLWNVLVGEMSLVGPRPIYDPNEVRMFGDHFPFYLRVRPGLTGLWQVSGRNNTTYNSRIRLDIYYVRNWSMWLDYFVLLRTIRTVLRREGSY